MNTFLLDIYRPLYYLCMKTQITEISDMSGNTLQPISASGSQRIDVVDVLRGIAIGGIVIIHFLEHLDFYDFPPLTSFDHAVWNTVFFLFAGKMYAVFALLFGFSFYVQDANSARRGEDFRLRFAWRMILLMALGLFDMLFYNGDILFLYAVCSLPLIPFIRASDRVLRIAALILFIQPVEVVLLVAGLFNPQASLPLADSGPYFEAMMPAKAHGSFFDVAAVGLRYGIPTNFIWSLQVGRLTQILFLFVSGILLGRRGLFCDSEDSMRFWKRTLAAGLASSALLLLLASRLPTVDGNECVSRSLCVMLDMWKNIAMMLVIVSCVILAFYRTPARRLLLRIAPYGRMSLTNYIGQSVFGALLFYNFGFGLYRCSGHAVSLLLGVGFVIVQYAFCRLWLRHHRRGPFEELWHRGTWIFSKR